MEIIHVDQRGHTPAPGCARASVYPGAGGAILLATAKAVREAMAAGNLYEAYHEAECIAAIHRYTECPRLRRVTERALKRLGWEDQRQFEDRPVRA